MGGLARHWQPLLLVLRQFPPDLAVVHSVRPPAEHLQTLADAKNGVLNLSATAGGCCTSDGQ